MSSAFIQVDKPFYFAGDTIQGHIFLNLVETINANEILVKFKGWEAVRWIEERVIPEQEQQNIQSNLIWHNVTTLTHSGLPRADGKLRLLRPPRRG
jgi:hypothetical protein